MYRYIHPAIQNLPIAAINVDRVIAFMQEAISSAKEINDLVEVQNSDQHLERLLQITEVDFFIHLLQQANERSLSSDIQPEP